MQAKREEDYHRELWLNGLKEGLQFKGDRLFMFAQELMTPSWKENQNKAKWNEWSIDFLLVNNRMHLYPFELKRKIVSEGDAWRVLSQATHRSFEIQESYTKSNLLQIYNLTRGCETGVAFEDAFQTFYGQKPTIPEKPKVHPIAAAPEISSTCEKITQKFNSANWDDLKISLEKYADNAANRDMYRLIRAGSDALRVRPVELLVIP